MKICLLGEAYGPLDEAMRNTTYYLYRELSKNNEVMVLDLRKTFTVDFWRKLREFGPDIVHYIHGPTIKSFMLSKAISRYCRHCKIVMSATRPNITKPFRVLIPMLKPDLVLVLSQYTENMVKKFGCRTKFFPVGVDTEKFCPMSNKEKTKLREKYNLDSEKYIVLHIGSIREGRNIRLLKKIQSEDTQVVILGRTTINVDSKLYKELKSAGCIVWVEYIKNVEELYAIADCYAYPTVHRWDWLGRATADSIEMPMTVLEAMACNLPVVTMKFGALPIFFEEGDGLYFAESESEFVNAVEVAKNANVVKTRNKVMPYSWERIAKMLEDVYEDLLKR